MSFFNFLSRNLGIQNKLDKGVVHRKMNEKV